MELIALAIGFGIAVIAVALMVEEKSKGEKAKETAEMLVDAVLAMYNPHTSKEEKSASYEDLKTRVNSSDDDIAVGLRKLDEFSHDKYDSLVTGSFAKRHASQMRKSIRRANRGEVGIIYVGNAVAHQVIPGDIDELKKAERKYRDVERH